jgi:hypothetical protein
VDPDLDVQFVCELADVLVVPRRERRIERQGFDGLAQDSAADARRRLRRHKAIDITTAAVERDKSLRLKDSAAPTR